METMIISKKISMLVCLMLCLSIAAFGAGCGKKGPPTLKSFEKPDAVKETKVTYRDGKIEITWSYVSQKKDVVIQGFYIDRAEGRSAYENIAILPADAIQYTDANVKLDAQYRYKIRAFNKRDITADDATEIKVVPVTPPAPPQGITYKLKNDAVEISWDKAAEGVFFNVYRSEVKGVYTGAPLNEKPLVEPFFRDGLNASAKVYYTVIAFVQSTITNESALSAEIEIDPNSFIPAVVADIRYVRSDYRGYISWKESPEQWVAEYKVYRKRASGVFETIATVNVPVFLDEEPITEETSYYITASGPVKESEPSAIVTVKP
jgi:hypothetical protein